MSLILEALKRAERDHKRKQTPDLRSVLQENNPGGRRFGVWFSILCVVLLVVVIVLAKAFWPEEHAQAPEAPVTAEEKEPEQEVQEPSLSPEENPFTMLAKRAAKIREKRPKAGADDALQELARALGRAKAETVEDVSDAGPNESVATDKKDAGRSRTTRDREKPRTRLPGKGAASAKKRNVEKARRPSTALGTPEDDTAFVQPQEPEDMDASQDLGIPEEPAGQEVSPETIPTIYELPLMTQQKLADFSLNVHAYYDDPEKRFVYINMKRYQAGDRIGDNTGPVLEEIIPEGVIIDYGDGKARLLISR